MALILLQQKNNAQIEINWNIYTEEAWTAENVCIINWF